MFKFIGKHVQNSNDPENKGFVIAETGTTFHPEKTVLLIELSKEKKKVRICVDSRADENGFFKKISGKAGFIKIIEG